jgi:hypothetical protein
LIKNIKELNFKQIDLFEGILEYIDEKEERIDELDNLLDFINFKKIEKGF